MALIGVSEVIQTIGAMIIFSLLLLASNRMIQSNTLREVETEAVGVATTIAQSIIKEAQALPFDNTTAAPPIPIKIPEGFDSCGSDGGNRSTFDDFDDYHGYKTYVKTKFGSEAFYVSVKVLYVSPSESYDISKGSTTDRTMFKKMVVTVSSKYLKEWKREIKLSYLRRFYKTTDS